MKLQTMKISTIRYCLVMAITAFLLPTALFAQKDKSKRASPPATATGKIGEATITIDYSSPSVKGRKIWGELVPYNKVWRAGANEATVFTTDKDIKVEGKSLPAGKYSLYAIPGEKEWTIILNSQTGQWGVKMDGETTEDPAKDVVRVNVKPEKAKNFAEQLSYSVNANGFALTWENVEVPVSVK
ncbi:MAG: DUF2911 domain-containing protein [Bacteroidetes bacterium]|nr:DUF2911 domain-containing protein [Bacteroidota bacterium]MBS1632266.1 DUF2911 domain-containing protein [Bacteroidota bacterium]